MTVCRCRVNAAQHILIFGIGFYRWVISPAKSLLFGPLGRCRFTPSCSQYALDAIRRRGALTGGWLALRRLSRCHPWGACGHDPVPTAPPPSTPASAFQYPLPESEAGRVNSSRAAAALSSGAGTR